MRGNGVAGLGFGRPRGCCRCQLGRPGWPDGQLGRGLVGGSLFFVYSFLFLFYFTFLFSIIVFNSFQFCKFIRPVPKGRL